VPGSDLRWVRGLIKGPGGEEQAEKRRKQPGSGARGHGPRWWSCWRGLLGGRGHQGADWSKSYSGSAPGIDWRQGVEARGLGIIAPFGWVSARGERGWDRRLTDVIENAHDGAGVGDEGDNRFDKGA
jgi:hypothetical protein